MASALQPAALEAALGKVAELAAKGDCDALLLQLQTALKTISELWLASTQAQQVHAEHIASLKASLVEKTQEFNHAQDRIYGLEGLLAEKTQQFLQAHSELTNRINLTAYLRKDLVEETLKFNRAQHRINGLAGRLAEVTQEFFQADSELTKRSRELSQANGQLAETTTRVLELEGHRAHLEEHKALA